MLGALDAGQLAATVMVGHDGHRGWVYYLDHLREMRAEKHKDEIEALKAEVKTIKSLVGLKVMNS